MDHLNLKLIDLKILKLIDILRGGEAEAPNFILLFEDLNSGIENKIDLFEFNKLINNLIELNIIIYNIGYNIFVDFDFDNLNEEFYNIL